MQGGWQDVQTSPQREARIETQDRTLPGPKKFKGLDHVNLQFWGESVGGIPRGVGLEYGAAVG